MLRIGGLGSNLWSISSYPLSVSPILNRLMQPFSLFWVSVALHHTGQWTTRHLPFTEKRWINTRRWHGFTFMWAGAEEQNGQKLGGFWALSPGSENILYSLEFSSILTVLPASRNSSTGKHSPVGGFPIVCVRSSLLPFVWCIQGREEKEVSSS